MKKTLLTLTSFALCFTLNAQLVLNDNFDYGSGDLASGYGGWSDGSNNIRYESSVNASWTDADNAYVFDSAGGSFYSGVQPENNSRGAQQDVAGLTGEFWVSAMVRNNGGAANTGTFIGFDGSGYGSTGFDFDAFGLSGIDTVLVRKDGSWTDTGVALSSETWQLFVAQITIATDAPDTLNLWVFDSASSFGLDFATAITPTYTDSAMNFGNGPTAIHIGARKATDGGQGYIDNVRISVADGVQGAGEVVALIPEPSTYAMMATALLILGLAIRRRR